VKSKAVHPVVDLGIYGAHEMNNILGYPCLSFELILDAFLFPTPPPAFPPPPPSLPLFTGIRHPERGSFQGDAQGQSVHKFTVKVKKEGKRGGGREGSRVGSHSALAVTVNRTSADEDEGGE
jgi:hypothetical protein